MKQRIEILVVVIAMIAQVGCTRSAADDAESTASLPTVRVVNPSYHAISSAISITGRAEPNEHVRVHAREGGYVKRVLKDLGDRVKAGDALAELEAPELLQQLRQLEAEANAKRSIRDRIATARTSTPALTPAQVAEDAGSAHAMAEAALATIRERITFLTVRAPIAGVITQRMVDPGALVQTGTTNANAMALFELQAIDPVRIVIPVPARDAIHARIGIPAKVRFPDLEGSEVTATVSRTSGSLDAGTGSMQVQLDVPNPNGELRPGMIATVELRPATSDSTWSLPTTTSFAQGGTNYLMLVRGGKVEQLPLKKGLSDKDRFQVLEPVLTAKDLIIIEGRNLVRVGDAVEPIIQN